MAKFLSGRQLRAKRQKERREQYGDDYVTGKVKGLQSKVLENQRAGRFGEITGAEVALRNTGDTIETLLSPIGDAVPDFIAEPVGAAVGAGMQYAAETPVGQEVVKYAQENPRMFDNLGAAVNIGGVLPLARIGKTAINSGAARVNTMLEGFYGGGTAGQVWSAAKGALSALPSTVADELSPKAVAYERVTGVPRSKGKASGEVGQGERGREVSVGSALTTDSIRRQRGLGPAEFIDKGPIGAMDTIDVIPATNKKVIKEQLFSKGKNIRVEVPEVVQNRAMNHLYSKNVWGFDPTNTEIKIKTPAGVQNVGKEGVIDGSQQSSVVLRMLGSGEATKTGTKTMPTLSKTEIIKRKARGLISEKVDVDVDGKKKKKNKLKGTNFKFDGSTSTTADVATDTFKTFMEKKKRPMGKASEKDLVEYFTTNGIKVNKGGKGDPHLYIGSSHHSGAKELGGVNDFIAINPKTGDIYTMISDQHDMFGMDPVGGQSLVAVVPMQKSNFKKPSQKKWTKTRNVDTGLEDPKTKKRMKEASKRLEGMSGIPQNKGEVDINYNFRVLREFDPKAQAQDVATVARRSGMLAAAPQPFMSEEEQGGR